MEVYFKFILYWSRSITAKSGTDFSELCATNLKKSHGEAGMVGPAPFRFEGLHAAVSETTSQRGIKDWVKITAKIGLFQALTAF
jgi:hypothetical protein